VAAFQRLRSRHDYLDENATQSSHLGDNPAKRAQYSLSNGTMSADG
jgi:hypothetical protein